MREEANAELGYCRECKKFGRLVKLYSIEASPHGLDSPTEEGLFLEDEVKFEKTDQGWIGVKIVPEAFKSCKFKYVDEEEILEVCKISGNEECPFHTYYFDWGSEEYYLIDCDCLQTEFKNYLDLKKHASEICPCVREDEFDDFSNVEYNSISPIRAEDPPLKAIKQKKIPGELVIPTILKAATFIHMTTYNVDNYFLGILQTLAVKGVNVIIVLNPGTLTKGKLKAILNIASYSRGNLQIVVNNKVHAKRVFSDGIYDLDLASINLSYNALYDNIENIPEISFATPSLNERSWEIIRDTHNQKFISAFREGEDIFEWCHRTKPDVYRECSKAFARREKENELIKKMRD
jgi:hypothetical protein